MNFLPIVQAAAAAQNIQIIAAQSLAVAQQAAAQAMEQAKVASRIRAAATQGLPSPGGGAAPAPAPIPGSFGMTLSQANASAQKGIPQAVIIGGAAIVGAAVLIFALKKLKKR